MSREGQVRVEIRSGVYIWMNEADHKAWQQRNPPVPPNPQPAAPETAAVEPPETTAAPKPRKR